MNAAAIQRHTMDEIGDLGHEQVDGMVKSLQGNNAE